MKTITLANGPQGWTATFDGFDDMPSGVALPLPLTAEAHPAAVKADMRKRFADATITFASSVRVTPNGALQ